MEAISKEFLEEALGEEILHFKITTEPTSDYRRTNFSYAVEVQLKRSRDIFLHYILKCYPQDSAGREGTVIPSNSLRQEYLVYHSFIPELKKFQRNTRNIYSNPGKHHFIKHPFTELIFGKALDHFLQPAAGNLWSRFLLCHLTNFLYFLLTH